MNASQEDSLMIKELKVSGRIQAFESRILRRASSAVFPKNFHSALAGAKTPVGTPASKAARPVLESDFPEVSSP